MASAVRSLTGLAATRQHFAAQTVHIKIHPRPQNLRESRKVLQVLEKFGEVVMFRNLRYYHGVGADYGRAYAQYEYHGPASNNALAMYKYASSVSELLAASPLRFDLGSGVDPSISDRLQTPSVAQIAGHLPPQFQKLGSSAINKTNSHTLIQDSSSSCRDGEDRIQHAAQQNTMNQRTWRSSSTAFQPSDVKPALTSPNVSADVGDQKDFLPLENVAREVASDTGDCTSREVYLSVSTSHFDHQDYIERQPYHGNFITEKKSPMAEELASSVPFIGLSDSSVHKSEIPVRIRNRRRENLAETRSLRDLWETGLQNPAN
ncbi:MAG: hypothetical protein M1827_001302 [Pycnora praestabilis]|nr:MAG: hypothetical protein M1827_001302 [Pycnora praestabilis]